MNRTCMILLLILLSFFSFTSLSLATDMSQGLQCPPGWNDNRAARGNDLIKQCTSPAQDAAIELYAAPGQEVPLDALLDMWAQEMTKEGLPFQNKVSQVPGQVSGYPAVTRTYSGHTRDGNQFDSHLVASRYNGVNYVFQGFALKGRSQSWHQLRHSMNTWYYPGAGQQNHGSQLGGLPLGAGSSGNDPYGNQQPSSGNDPYGNTPYGNQQAAVNSGNSLPTISGTFLADIKDYWNGKYHYRIYHFNGDGTYVSGSKNAKTGKVTMSKHKKRFRISKSGNLFVVSSGGSCTEGYVTDTEANEITRFKSGCYSPGGRAMYFKKIHDNFSNTSQGGNTAGAINSGSTKPKIAGTFVSDLTDYWGGKEHYRIYQFYTDGTYIQGSKAAKSGKITMGKNKFKYKIKKSSGNKTSYVIKGSKTYCTEGFIKKTKGNVVTSFQSGCYTHKGRKRLNFNLIRN
ncbi:hypothetical protein [Desulfovibrio sp. JC010]|uniref:hypothetical protein n=1 Tax=Desulfovibrio sp. JC010 TaxID=2593641 RepID=UPI0013D1DB08|nr:hypothetical protein [Desulfovibrio sp. JC010]NDV27616.1 hypothetical protein [Desulfovibrio sp. JC010]